MKLLIDGKYNVDRKEIIKKLPKMPKDATPMQTTEIDVKESTELGETLRELNKDEEDSKTRMSDIDLRANLVPGQVAGILAIDGLCVFNFLPHKAQHFTRKVKRLSVSVFGKGRQDIVDIAAGKRENDMNAASGMTLGNRMKNLFGAKEEGK